jgi:tetratricopeptide (TPR) repeat protein
MQEKLLTDTEASIYLGITKELLYAYVRNAPKKGLNHDRKLVSVEVDGCNRFRIEDLDSFDSYLKEPWSIELNKRPEIPSYILDYLKTEIGGKCPITGKGYPLENAHIEDYSVSKSHHHHNIIRIAKEEHTKFDNKVLPKSSLLQIKNSLIEALRKKMENSPSETKIVTYLPNIDIEKIKGRHLEIEKIHKSIVENGKVTIVNGFGGIGKTSLAQLYSKLYYHEYDYFFWVEFPNLTDNSSSKEIFMSGIATNFLILSFLGISTDHKIPLENQFQLVLNRISQLPGRKLLVLDNVPNTIREFSLLIPTSSDFNVLGTSRSLIEDFTNLTIDILKEVDAVDLFYSFYTLETDDALVLQILKSFGFHTLAIELISKFAIKRKLTLDMLYQIISTEGVNTSLEAKVTTTHDKNREPKTPFNYLLEIFDVSNLSCGQISLLRNLSVIGSIHLSFNQLENLLNDESESNELFHNLTDLHKLGWIIKLNDQYYIHQLICEVLCFKLKPTFEQCKIVVDRVLLYIEKSSNEFSIHLQKPYVEIAEQISSIIPLPKNISSQYKIFIARHYGFSGNYDKYNVWYCNSKIEDLDTEIKKYSLINHGNILLSQGKSTEAIDVLEQCKTVFEDERTLAQINATIALAYSELGNFIKANKLFESAYKVLENDSDLSKSEFAVFVNNYSKILNGLGNYNKALELSIKALKLREELLEDNHPLLAQSYNNIGVDYEYLGQFDKALQFHSKALQIRKNFGEENNADLAESFHNLASLYFQRREFSKSKDYFERAVVIREKVYPDGNPSLILTYCCFASLMIEIDSTQAVQLFKKAFSFSKKFDFKNNQNYPFWLMGFSIALFESGDYKEALNYINLAIEIFEKLDDQNGTNNAVAFKNRILAVSPQSFKIKQGRNELCSCGSGKKYKKCCGSF